VCAGEKNYKATTILGVYALNNESADNLATELQAILISIYDFRCMLVSAV
jgi:hypothetical protein